MSGKPQSGCKPPKIAAVAGNYGLSGLSGAKNDMSVHHVSGCRADQQESDSRAGLSDQP